MQPLKVAVATLQELRLKQSGFFQDAGLLYYV